MKLEEAIEFMWKENEKNFKGIQWEQHRTIRILHDKLIRKIYADFKLELEAEYKRGWKDRATQSDLENRTCESCKHKEDNGFGWVRCYKLGAIFRDISFGCNEWLQK